MRGGVVHYGVTELDESEKIHLAQFENDPDGSLRHPRGCLPEQLTQPVAVDG